ncbi:hypothetical protein [Microbispora bryophytorum]|nr:hypothetical protein [Microbispora camponoti]
MTTASFLILALYLRMDRRVDTAVCVAAVSGRQRDPRVDRKR